MFPAGEAVAEVYRDLRLASELRRVLRHTARLTGSAAGSVSLVDAGAGRYTKAAEYGALCRLGDTFPLDEGATGWAFSRRRPVVIAEYGRLRAGHLAGSDPVRRGPAAAVPIWWRGDVIAVSVTFAPRAGLFTAREIDDLEILTQTMAAAIVRPDGLPGGEIEPLIATEPSSPAGRRSPARPRGARVPTGDEPKLPAMSEDPASTRRRGLPLTGREGPALTVREADVLGLMRTGLTYREIAVRLGLSPKTVEKHVGAIMRKTGTSNRTEAVVTALDQGWLGLGETPHTAYG
ncbi:hypothetical protein Abr02nite_24150 [Paractinoplanes brasiliensis]|nr:hypothetical protein Abr02nite_24150 [Actinoplanes brasiliensis]